MERFLIESEIMKATDDKSISRTSLCPDESWYWDFMDGHDSNETMSAHAASCSFCCNELRQVGRAMLAVSDGQLERNKSTADDAAEEDDQLEDKSLGRPKDSSKDLGRPPPKFNIKDFLITRALSLSLKEIPEPPTSGKVILRAVGGSILEIFNSLETVPAYRAHTQGLIVLAAPGFFQGFKLEISALGSGKFSLVGQADAETWFKDVSLELADESGVLRSLSMQPGERRSLGDWGGGRYRLTLKGKHNRNYTMEINLR
jgi:hypothetical protein